MSALLSISDPDLFNLSPTSFLFQTMCVKMTPNGTSQRLRLVGAAKARQAMPLAIITTASPIKVPRTHRKRHNTRIKTRFPQRMQVKDAIPSIPTQVATSSPAPRADRQQREPLYLLPAHLSRHPHTSFGHRLSSVISVTPFLNDTHL
jgi:hypothetical protein